jgi:Cft2 family RNA processing exonuclease
MDFAAGGGIVSARLIAVSGLAAKGPAAFLLETEARRILLDFGEGPDEGALPPFEAIGRVDALVLSHGHKDHLGAIAHIDRIGRPPVFATDRVLRQVPADLDRRALPKRGRTDILGLRVEIGRNGHAPGGVWLRFDLGNGFLYTGDYSRESAAYMFDEPPGAATVLLDASYGMSDEPLRAGQETLARIAAAGPILLPSPADGRGPDMALYFHELGYQVALDEATRDAVRMLAERPDLARPDAAERLAALARAARPLAPDTPAQGAMIASNGSGSSGVARALTERWADGSAPPIVFTGYVGKGTPAARLVAGGRASVVRWNVHPRLEDNRWLVRIVGARQVIPAFLELGAVEALRTAFGAASVTTERVVAL